MHIQTLTLTQFRSYASLKLDLQPGVNCLFGENGAGKTNILDAIHYLALAKGFRSSKDLQAVKSGDEFFLIEGLFSRDTGLSHVQCNFVKGRGKKVLVDQQAHERLSDHIGRIPLVAILPDDTTLITEGSAFRRRFLDILISQYNHDYLSHLIHYDRLLSQRNAQLRLFAEQGGFDAEQLEIWTTQLIPHGIRIVNGRKQFLDGFIPLFKEYFRQIVSQKEQPRIRYRSQIEDNSIDGWLQLFASRLEKDRSNLFTTAGTHRDDLIFSIHDREVKSYGSQGQQKTFVIALKLAQYHLLARETQRPPLLLLDDIFDKLDEQRLRSIAHILDRDIEGQVFITDTSRERLNKIFHENINRNVSYFHVTAGSVSPA